MNSTLGKLVVTGALIGAVAVAGVVPAQAAQGRNAAFATGVAVGAVGGAALSGGYGYGAYPAYGYYGGPRYAYGYRPYRHRYYRRHW
jgi:hypothetical protein